MSIKISDNFNRTPKETASLSSSLAATLLQTFEPMLDPPRDETDTSPAHEYYNFGFVIQFKELIGRAHINANLALDYDNKQAVLHDKEQKIDPDYESMSTVFAAEKHLRASKQAEAALVIRAAFSETYERVMGSTFDFAEFLKEKDDYKRSQNSGKATKTENDRRRDKVRKAAKRAVEKQKSEALAKIAAAS